MQVKVNSSDWESADVIHLIEVAHAQAAAWCAVHGKQVNGLPDEITIRHDPNTDLSYYGESMTIELPQPNTGGVKVLGTQRMLDDVSLGRICTRLMGAFTGRRFRLRSIKRAPTWARKLKLMAQHPTILAVKKAKEAIEQTNKNIQWRRSQIAEAERELTALLTTLPVQQQKLEEAEREHAARFGLPWPPIPTAALPTPPTP